MHCLVYAIQPETKARLFVATGAPVQPHSSDGLQGLDVTYRWIQIPKIIFKHVNLPENVCSVEGFCQYFDIGNPLLDVYAHQMCVCLLIAFAYTNRQRMNRCPSLCLSMVRYT